MTRMRDRIVACALALGALAPLPGTPRATFAAEAQDPTRLVLDGRAAYSRGEFAAAFESFRRASELRPRNPVLLQQLAACASRAGRDADALQALRRLLRLRVTVPMEADSDFATLRATPAGRAMADSMRALDARRVDGGSVPAFRLSEPDFIPEGVARGRRGEFYVGSVHRRKIVRVDRAGKVTEFASEGQDSLGEVLGMVADTTEGKLWVCSSEGPEMLGFEPGRAGRAALHAFMLRTGRYAGRVLPPDPDSAHNFNDIAQAPDGSLMVSDPLQRCVYRLGPGGQKLHLLVPPGPIVSPQGLAVSRDGRRLYVSDYARGLVVVDLPTREVRPVACPNDVTLYGIDGLSRHGDDLIAVQNGVRPARVLRLKLAADRDSVTSATILEMNHPEFREPTLGVVVENDFYYVANSQWPLFDPEGQLPPADRLKPPVVLRLPLK
ncbi:MAG: SMP-30/gluconolactonase/LRE family protein [Candidatus Eisenbacteria bacterium]|nr:SMP-30/gluconolactonase/LRE family protein [Candidatus Eisenbacteria bacterium]